MTKRLGVLFVISCMAVCLAAAKAPKKRKPQAANDLILIKVKGTTIDRLPKHVDVITDSPKEEGEKLVAAGGRRNGGDVPNSYYRAGVLYIFATPKSWNEATNHEFAAGDVIYTYLVGSREERTEFATRYKLTKTMDLKGKVGPPSPLYRASPGYYVLVLAPATVYMCAMHPQAVLPAAGHCPLCGMDLVPVETYQ